MEALEQRPPRRRRHRRLPAGARHREPALRPAGRRRDAPPRGLDRGGPGPRRASSWPSRSRRPSPAAWSPRRSTSPRSAPRRSRCSGPFLPLARQLGQLVGALPAAAVSPLRDLLRGRSSAPSTRACSPRPSSPACCRATSRSTSTWSTPASLAAERGIEWTRDHHAAGPRLHQPPVAARGATSASAARPSARPRGRGWWRPSTRTSRSSSRPHVGLFRYLDIPGQIGRVGTILGLANVNIASMAVSRSRAEGGRRDGGDGRLAGRRRRSRTRSAPSRASTRSGSSTSTPADAEGSAGERPPGVLHDAPVAGGVGRDHRHARQRERARARTGPAAGGAPAARPASSGSRARWRPACAAPAAGSPSGPCRARAAGACPRRGTRQSSLQPTRTTR